MMERDPLTGKVIGAAIEVHRELGPGYDETVYENALAVEMELRGPLVEVVIPGEKPVLYAKVKPEDIPEIIERHFWADNPFIKVRAATEGWLKKLREWAREKGILFTLDEVQASYGRTGKMWAADHEDLQPDLLALGNDESQNDGWAPLDGPKVCQDEAQRWRPEHTSDKDGRCIFRSARTRTGL